MVAANIGHYEICLLLLDSGAVVDLPLSVCDDGWTFHCLLLHNSMLVGGWCHAPHNGL